MKNANMKRPLAAAAALILLVSIAAAMLTPRRASAVFTDIADHPDKAVIEKWENSGVINGYDEDDGTRTFRPDDLIERGEYAKIAFELFKYIATGGDYFSDLGGHWASNYVLLAAKAGIIHGDGVDQGNTVRPDDNIKREEAFAVLRRAFQLDENEAGLAKFSDGGDVSPWFPGEVGAIAPYLDGNEPLRPQEPITRAEFLVTVDKIVGGFYNKAQTVKGDINGAAVVNTTDVVLDGAKVNGNLYVAQGVGKGDFTLKDSEVVGTVHINGGGKDTIKIINTIVREVKAEVDPVTGTVRIWTDEKSTVETVHIADGSDKVILEGEFKDVNVQTWTNVEIAPQTVITGTITVGDNSTVTVSEHAKVQGTIAIAGDYATVDVGKNATVNKIVKTGDSATVTVAEKAVVNSVDIQGDYATLTAAKDSTVKSVTISGSHNTVEGVGRVEDAVITDGINNRVTTSGTNVNNQTDAPVWKDNTNSAAVQPGEQVVNPGTLPPTVPQDTPPAKTEPTAPPTNPPGGNDIIIVDGWKAPTFGSYNLDTNVVTRSVGDTLPTLSVTAADPNELKAGERSVFTFEWYEANTATAPGAKVTGNVTNNGTTSTYAPGVKTAAGDYYYYVVVTLQKQKQGADGTTWTNDGTPSTATSARAHIAVTNPAIDVTLTNVSADGSSSGTATTTLTLTFNKPVVGLQAANITIDGVPNTNAPVKSATTTDGTVWTLAYAGTADKTITVAVTGYYTDGSGATAQRYNLSGTANANVYDNQAPVSPWSVVATIEGSVGTVTVTNTNGISSDDVPLYAYLCDGDGSWKPRVVISATTGIATGNDVQFVEGYRVIISKIPVADAQRNNATAGVTARIAGDDILCTTTVVKG